MSQPTLWGHASRVPGRGWRGAVPPLTPPNGTGTSWTLDRAGGSSPLRLAGPSRWLIAAPSPPADSLPRTTSDSAHDPALAHAGASAPAPAQRLGERPVVPGQVRHLRAELRDMPLQGFDLPPQGLDLRGVLLLRLLVLRGQRPQGGVAVA